MLGRQVRVVEAFMRARDWMSRMFDVGGRDVQVAKQVADFADLVSRAQRAAAHQDAGHRQSRAATSGLRDAVRRLRDRHLRPIAVIAQASFEHGDAPVGLDRALRMPHRRMPVTLLDAEARAFGEVAKQHEAWFVGQGHGAGFLEGLDAAVEDVRAAVRRRNKATEVHVGATVALQVHLRRARRVLAVVDSYVRVRFEGDEAALTEWRTLARVHQKPGRPRGAAVEEPEVQAPMKLLTAGPAALLEREKLVAAA